MDYSSLSCFLKSLSGCELIALSGLISVSIARGLSADELSVLGSFVTTIGDNLSLLASRQNLDDLC